MVAEIDIPASVTGRPMSYLSGGRQYVVFAVGDNRTTAEIVALALPDVDLEDPASGNPLIP